MLTIKHQHMLKEALLEADLLGSDKVILSRSLIAKVQIDVDQIARLIVQAMTSFREFNPPESHFSGKIPAIKALRAATGLGLKDSKDLVEGHLIRAGYLQE